MYKELIRKFLMSIGAKTRGVEMSGFADRLEDIAAKLCEIQTVLGEIIRSDYDDMHTLVPKYLEVLKLWETKYARDPIYNGYITEFLNDISKKCKENDISLREDIPTRINNLCSFVEGEAIKFINTYCVEVFVINGCIFTYGEIEAADGNFMHGKDFDKSMICRINITHKNINIFSELRKCGNWDTIETSDTYEGVRHILKKAGIVGVTDKEIAENLRRHLSSTINEIVAEMARYPGTNFVIREFQED